MPAYIFCTQTNEYVERLYMYVYKYVCMYLYPFCTQTNEYVERLYMYVCMYVCIYTHFAHRQMSTQSAYKRHPRVHEDGGFLSRLLTRHHIPQIHRVVVSHLQKSAMYVCMYVCMYVYTSS